MTTPTFTKTFQAGAAIGGGRIAKFGAADNLVIAAAGAAAAEFAIGITEYVPDGTGGATSTPLGGDVDVVQAGWANVVLGGIVTRGQPLAADANGAAVVAAPAAGANNRIIGFAMASGVAGDVIPVFVQPSFMQG